MTLYACAGRHKAFPVSNDGAGNLTRFDKWNTTTSQVDTVLYVINSATPLTMVLSSTRSVPTTGTTTTRYWHALDTLAQSDGTTTDYFAYDGLGSVRQLLDASGSVGLAQTFDPYGNGYAKAGSAASNLGFTGEQTDSNGFVFLRARYYQPGMGRFTQMDPSRQERNAYQYSAGNPVIFVDLSGLMLCKSTDSAADCARAIVAHYRVIKSDLEALAQLFVNDELDPARYPQVGSSAQDRLEFVLDITFDGRPSHFAIDFGETGLRREFQDGCFYDDDGDYDPGETGWEWHRDPGTNTKDGNEDLGVKTNQIGHFLTAVSIAHNHVFEPNAPTTIDYFGNHWVFVDDAVWGAEILISVAGVIGHEMISDDDKPALQLMAGSRPLLCFLFMSAVADDLNRQDSLRDANLAMVFYSGGFYTDDSTQWKQGNSLNDLKLSAKWFSFAAWVRYGGTNFSRAGAANWLRNNLG